MLVRAEHDALHRERVDVDMRVDAALAHDLQLREPLDQRRANRRALADEHERFRVLQALGEDIGVLRVVVPDRDVVAVELPERLQRPYDVLVVVEYRDLHLIHSCSFTTRSTICGAWPM